MYNFPMSIERCDKSICSFWFHLGQLQYVGGIRGRNWPVEHDDRRGNEMEREKGSEKGRSSLMNTSSKRTLSLFSSYYFSFICDEDSSSLIRYHIDTVALAERGAGFMILSLRVSALFPSHHLSIMVRGNHLLHANYWPAVGQQRTVSRSIMTPPGSAPFYLSRWYTTHPRTSAGADSSE